MNTGPVFPARIREVFVGEYKNRSRFPGSHIATDSIRCNTFFTLPWIRPLPFIRVRHQRF